MYQRAINNTFYSLFLQKHPEGRWYIQGQVFYFRIGGYIKQDIFSTVIIKGDKKLAITH